MRRALAAASCGLLAACTARGPGAPPATVAVPIQRPPERVTDGHFAFQGALTQGGLAIGQAPPGATAVFLDGRPVKLAVDGRFVIGFGRDAATGALVEATVPGGRVRERLRVAPRAWPIERLPGPRASAAAPDPAYAALRARETAAFAAARAIGSDERGWTERLLWPVTGRISGVFGAQRVLGGVPRDPHGGVDIARPAGTPVTAPASGVVVLASPPAYSLEGNMVFIDHGHGLVSTMMHLSRVDVRVGQRVRQGDPIGAVGRTGRATGPHLHWGLTWGAVRVDPALTVPPMRAP